MTTTTLLVAQQRQLDWLLGEVLGGEVLGGEVLAGDLPALAARNRSRPVRATSWLAAAIALLAVGVAIGVAVLRQRAPSAVAQDPEPTIDWHECHGADAIDAVPGDIVNLRTFDFDDAACARLVRFAKLERLDLSGMDVDARGVSRSIQITDAGVRALGALTKLRWLSLRGCHDMKGEGLQALEALPGLEHLDLTYSGIESPAVERLPRLPSLRTLVLSHCMNFHGRSLAAVATMPGLRRLELRACTTLAAKDVLPLAKLKELRYLDLRDCQGQFRGQTASFGGLGGEEPPPPPVQDGIGITDAVVEALSTMPLRTLLLGGSESLTDAIGARLATMTTLRVLDLSNLPLTSARLLPLLPSGLEELSLGDNHGLQSSELMHLPTMAGLRSLDVSGIEGVDDASLATLLQPCQLRVLALGGNPGRGKDGARIAARPITLAMATLVAAQTDLEELNLRNAAELAPAVMEKLATLPRLRRLDLTAALRNPLQDRAAAVTALAANRSIQELQLIWCRLTTDSLRALRDLPLHELDLYGTNLKAAEVLALAPQWPGCRIRLPMGPWHRVP